MTGVAGGDGAGGAAGGPAPGADLTELAARAARLHRESVVVDGHVDSILGVMRGERTLADRSERGHVDFPRLAEGGVNVQIFALFIEPPHKPDRAAKRALQLIDGQLREFERAPDRVSLVTDVAGLRRTLAEGRLAAILSIEGGEAIEGNLALLRMFHRLGVRAMGLTWNERNQIADGIGELRAGGGLTGFGVEVVREMNRLGMIVDVSHLTDRGFWDVLEVSSHPVAASHSNARAVCDHVRNLNDEQIRGLARNGGVMGMNFAPAFVHPERATLERVLDHVDHIAALVGTAHVGLGSDFDGIGSTPEGLEDCTRFPAFTEGLLRRGYRDEDVRAILGGNWLRLIEQVWGGA